MADHAAASVEFAFLPTTGIRATVTGSGPLPVHRALWRQDFLYDTGHAAYRQPSTAHHVAGLICAQRAAAELHDLGCPVTASPGLARAVLPALPASPDLTLSASGDQFRIHGAITPAAHAVLRAHQFAADAATGAFLLDDTAPTLVSLHFALIDLHQAGIIVRCDPSVLAHLPYLVHRAHDRRQQLTRNSPPSGPEPQSGTAGTVTTDATTPLGLPPHPQRTVHPAGPSTNLRPDQTRSHPGP